MQTPEEFAEDFREWMVANAQWPMLGDANATRKLEQIIRARDAEIRRECEERASCDGCIRYSRKGATHVCTMCARFARNDFYRAAIIGEEE